MLRAMNPWRSMRDLPKDLWFLGFALMVNRAGTMALPFLALFLARDRGLSSDMVGVILGTYGVGSLIGAPLGGSFSDRYGAPRVTIYSLFLSGFAWLAFPAADSVTAVLVAAFSAGLITESFRPASFAWIMQLAPKDKRKQAFAYARLMVNLGMSIGPPMGGLLAERWFDGIFYIDSLTCWIGAALVLVLARRTATDRDDESDEKGEAKTGAATKMALADPALLVPLAANLLCGLVFFQLDSTLPIHMVQSLGMTESDYGFLFIINTAMIIFLELALTDAVAKWSNHTTMALASLLVAIGFGACAWADSWLTLAFTVVVWTFGEMLLFPTVAAHISEIAPPGREGSYMGWLTATFGLAFTLAPGAGLWLLDTHGSRTLWLSVLAVGILSSVVFFFTRIPEERRAQADEKSQERDSHGGSHPPPSSRGRAGL